MKREAPSQRLDRLNREFDFIYSSGERSYVNDTTVVVDVADYQFLLSKAQVSLLLQAENDSLRYQLQQTYTGTLKEHNRHLEAVNKKLCRELDELKGGLS